MKQSILPAAVIEVVLLACAGAVYPVAIEATEIHEDAKLLASDAESGDLFGRSVALSGGTAVVGAKQNDAGGHNAGAAYVFVRNGTEWSEQVKLTASDAGFGGSFGSAVTALGNTAVVGSPGSRQTAYVFVRSGTDWSEQARLTASDAAANDAFGYSVAFSGGTVVVGAAQDDQQSGSAYVFGPPPVCGDGMLDPDEECDDGNNVDGDGCAADCTLEEIVIPAVTTRGAILLAVMLFVAATGVLIWRRRAM